MLRKLDNLAVLFLVLGGFVWGIIGLYGLNIVEYVFDREWLIRIIYVIFGIALVYHLITCRKSSKKKKAK